MRKKKEKGLPPSYEPGVVEVLFKDDAKIRMAEIPPGLKQPWKLISKTKVDLKRLNDFFTGIECLMARSTFTSSTEEEYDALHKRVKENRAKEKLPTAPSLNNFFAIHFNPTLDPVEIAKRLEQLPMVEKAYAVEKAIPPNKIPQEFRRYEIIEKVEELCRFMTMVGPCKFANIVGPIWQDTPLNEPLVGNRDTVYIVDPARNLENQWYIFRCNADAAWPLATGRGVVVADIDWGFRTSHQDLTSRFDMNHAYNSYDGGNTVDNVGHVYHGTGVTGLAGAADNSLGMIGFAFGCTMWPIQANTGPGAPLGGNAWANAIDWVRAQQTNARRVIILEVQTGTFHNYESIPSVNAAIINAIADGIVVCVAGGNGDNDAGLDNAGNPIPFTGAIVVGATSYDPNNNPRAGFSNWGARVDIVAPGDSNHDLTCDDVADDAYRNGFGGTSGATPKVAGTAAMMLECNPNLTPSEVRDIIMNTAGPVVTAANRPIGGFLDTHAAVHEACRQADPCRFNLVVDGCRRIRVVASCERGRIVDVCQKANILLDPCRLKSVVDIGLGCVRDRIVIGPCCTRELIAGTPFWHDDIFENWNVAYENLRNETLKHFKRLTVKK